MSRLRADLPFGINRQVIGSTTAGTRRCPGATGPRSQRLSKQPLRPLHRTASHSAQRNIKLREIARGIVANVSRPTGRT